jgi:hypothetical protein
MEGYSRGARATRDNLKAKKGQKHFQNFSFLLEIFFSKERCRWYSVNTIKILELDNLLEMILKTRTVLF